MRASGWALLLIACGAPAVGEDAGVDAGVGGCTSATECDDALFCNGEETCSEGACRAGTAPCPAGASCDEGSDGCDCAAAADADGDGHEAAACGGDDCDEADAQRFPGNTEICDTSDHDEDCDPRTFGFRDQDGDGFPDQGCCNVDDSDGRTCGDDCNDARSSTHPTEAESCNGADDDCDELVDEGVGRTFYPDTDGDGYGDPAGTPSQACAPPSGFVEDATDCDDARRGISPSAFESCDGADNDCDGTTDPGCDCTDGTLQPCGNSDVGACVDGRQLCLGGAWGDCVGAVLPQPELCNAIDDDCDGDVDEPGGPLVCAYGETRACTTRCGTAGTERCRADCSAWEPCRGTESCNGCDDDADGLADDEFLCERGRAYPCDTVCATPGQRICNATCDGYTRLGASLPECRGAEVCNYCDDDGDGTFAEDRGVSSSVFIASASGADYLRTADGGGCCSRFTQPLTDVSSGAQLSLACSTGCELPFTPCNCACIFGATMGVWSTSSTPLGFGAVTVELEVRAQHTGNCFLCTDGETPWSLVLLTDGGAIPTPDVALTTRRGIALEWTYAGDDTMRIVKYLGGVRTVIATASVPTGIAEAQRIDLSPCWTEARQRLVFTYVPDDPTTVSNEQRVALETFTGIRLLDALVSGPAVSAPGDRLRVGVNAGGSTNGQGESLRLLGPVPLRIRVEDVCI